MAPSICTFNGSLVSTGPVEDEGFVDFTFIQDVNNWLGRAQWGRPALRWQLQRVQRV